MASVSRLLDAIDQWSSKDITEFLRTIRSGVNESSNARNAQNDFKSPTSKKNLYMFRTARMMEQNSTGSNRVNPTSAGTFVPDEQARSSGCIRSCFPCIEPNPQQREGNTQTTNQQRVITTQPDPISVEPSSESGVTDSEHPEQEAERTESTQSDTRVNNMWAKEPSTSSSAATRETTLNEGTSELEKQEPLEGTVHRQKSQDSDDWSVKELTEEELGIEEDTSGITPQEAKQKKMLQRQCAVASSSGSSAVSSARETGRSAGTASTTSPPPSQPNQEEKHVDGEDSEQGSSSPLREAKSLHSPGEYEENTPHHAGLFGSNVSNVSEETNSRNWLEYFQDEYAENCSSWY